ncbi:calmodulin-binding transcription activator 1-like isoform X2 [Limulus polyphemus]|uniref:Calmodulin-binding transcription activator 1-like isoform X2 n=1 Tax=Limulus polyphemus TaxID=6850 RepID=A0ABM1RWU0_LIMPO|nr:calmodulin-binding transcription activator 1-like isoform X2 [Limulus polyphemus]
MADTENQVLSLAEKIIAAIPDRIKASSGELSDLMNVKNKANLQPADGRISNNISTQDKPSLELCSVKEPQPPLMSEEFSFEFSDHNYRYHEVGTPNSSSSTTSSCLQSPVSFTLESNSLPPTTADFCEFFQASGKIMERDFSNLTLSDREQRELYEAAKIIQKAYRSYKGRKRQEEQEKEKAAAILIQSYYRRYKQYLYYKETTRAVQVIQNQYRNYCELKKLKKSQGLSTSSNAGTGGRQSPSPSFLSLYKTNGNGNNRLSSSNCEGTPTSDFNTRRTYSQRSQNQAAKKIQQFMRHSKNNVWDLLHGRVIAGRTCISCRKREASGGSNEPAATVPKISGTAF